MLLGQGGRLACAGMAIGAIGAGAASRVLGSLIYGVSTFDPIACGAAAPVLMLVALAANLVPALAATRIEPVRALRARPGLLRLFHDRLRRSLNISAPPGF